MVPGMYHGNKGPNAFDALGALERWVEQGAAPEEMIATTYTNDDRTQPGLRTMPRCAFPKQARSSGSGDVNSAANRSCPFNEDLLQAGPSGALAGLEESER